MIKGIDSQIITGRLTDYVRDNSAKLKESDFNQALQNKMQATNIEKETKTVTDVKEREIRKTDDKDDGRKKNKQEQKKKEKKMEVVMTSRHINNDSNAVSGNETVGFGKISNIDIEV